jgi:phosphatidylglycerol:prolipoprotein diacylglycerol transferase
MTVYPFVLHIGFLNITGYGLMMMAAFLAAGYAIQLELRRRGLDEEFAASIVWWAVIGGLIGAKLWYVALTGQMDVLFRRGGFVWYGGLLGGSAGVILAGWLRKAPWRFTADLVAGPLALGYALGRVGCFLVNDDYGIPTSLPWGMKFPEGLPPTTVSELRHLHVSIPAGVPDTMVMAVHPTEIYETVIMLFVFWWLWKRRGHTHGMGWLFGCYLMFSGAERFLIEALRAKDDRLLGPFTLAQATAVVLVGLGFYLTRKWGTPDGTGADLAATLAPKPAAPAAKAPA